MAKYEEIFRRLSKNKKITSNVVSLLSKYIASLSDLSIINNDEEIDKLVNKVIENFEGVIYYDNKDESFLKKLGIGEDNKGLSVKNIIYVNNNMSEELKEVTLFHEFTHFLQRYYINGYEDCVGVMRDFKWRLLMEGQTQNVAELIYEHINNVKKEEKIFNSSELRMKSGGIIASNLRNYEMYDYVLKKVLLAIGISMEDFIYINFTGKLSMPIFEKILDDRIGEEKKEKLFRMLDIIYSSDVIKYSYSLDKLAEPYIVPSLVDQRQINVSCYNQFETMKKLDNLLLKITEDNKEVHSKLLDMQFIPGRPLKSNNDEQYYSTHYENGVETVKKNTLHI